MAQLVTTVFVVIGAAVLASPQSPFNGSSPEFMKALRDFATSSAIVVLPATIAMGIVFPATAALLGDEHGTEGSATGTLLAVNTGGSLVATFVLPFFVIPLIGSPATLALLAIVNAVVAGCAAPRRAPPRQRAPGGRVAWRRRPSSILVIATLVGGTAFRNPTIQLIEGRGGTVFEAAEDEIAIDRGGAGRGHAPAVGRRDGDDPAHRGHQVHAPAADRPAARRGSWPRDRLRHGLCLPDVAQRRRRRRTPWSWSRPCPG